MRTHRAQCRHRAPCGSTKPHEVFIHLRAASVHYPSPHRTGHPPLRASQPEKTEKVPSWRSWRSATHLPPRIGLTVEAPMYVLQHARALVAVAACPAPAAHSFPLSMSFSWQMLVLMTACRSTVHTTRARCARSYTAVDCRQDPTALHR